MAQAIKKGRFRFHHVWPEPAEQWSQLTSDAPHFYKLPRRLLTSKCSFDRAVNAVITIAIRLRYDYDPTTTYRARLLPFDVIRPEQTMNMSIFRRSRIVVVSQSNRTHIVISIVVVSSYRRFVVESQL